VDLQSEIAAHDLKALSIGHYIQAGFVAFYSLVMLVYFAFLGTIFTKLGTGGRALPDGVLAILSIVFSVVLFALALYTLCIFLAARWLRSHQRLLFIQIVSGLNCLFIPYGTVLGVFTLIVLARPQTKLLFSGPATEAAVADA
jgi:hypothetical protein